VRITQASGKVLEEMRMLMRAPWSSWGKVKLMGYGVKMAREKRMRRLSIAAR
jgi:hypothetical protein